MPNTEWLERKKYRAVWKHDKYRKYSPGKRHLETMLVMLNPSRGETFVDFGCGSGQMADAIYARGYRVQGVDIAANCLNKENEHIPLTVTPLWDMEGVEADYGICTDVMEHIPPEYVDEALKRIYKAVRNGCFFSISTVDDDMGALIGDTLHLTVKPAEWWGERLNDLFGSVFMVTYETELIAVCDKG